ncbi:MAG TPA: MBL fold metallo-hydrolase, partial [Ktedonobacterales bacterium]|nr:MBL fold metallo-hydrolase [Ktedonobacterales bacterium]
MTDSKKQQLAGAPLIACIPVGALAANCYLVTCPETRETIVVDPGDDAKGILARIKELGVEVVSIVHTHGHFDHIGATEAVLAGLPQLVAVAAHPADEYLYVAEARELGTQFGYALPERCALPDTPLGDGETIDVGTLRFRVLHTPGHTPGSISLVCGDACVLSGDTLFRRGIGRTDLPGGDEDRIYESILSRLYTLPEELLVLPGHGESTTIGEEQRGNPF